MTVSARLVLTEVLRAEAPFLLKAQLATVPRLPPGGLVRRRLELLAAIHRFAPEVRLHPDDIYRPTSVPWYLQLVRMRRHRAGWPDVQILNPDEVTVRSLISQSSGGQHSGEGGSRTNFFLQIATNEGETRRGLLGVAECYVHFRPAPDGSGAWDLQYWFFYAYNGNITWGLNLAHEGDFEHATVRVSRDSKTILRVFYGIHDTESEWREVGDFQLTNDGHPIVFSANQTHATYWRPGKQDRSGRPDDHTADGGPIWRTWDTLRLVGHRRRPMPGQEWIQYTGRWGEIGTFAWTSGPFGPAFQGYWIDDDDP